MKKTILFLLAIILYVNSYSQVEKKTIESYEKDLQKLEFQIDELEEAAREIKLLIAAEQAGQLAKSKGESEEPRMPFVTSNGAKMVDAAGLWGKLILKLDSGEVLAVISTKYDFIEVCNDTICGWIEKRYMSNIEDLEDYKASIELMGKTDEINKKFSPEVAKRILAHRVWIGMTSEMAKYSWGYPKDINSTTTAYGTSQQWVYGSGRYLYFENGILTTIQN